MNTRHGNFADDEAGEAVHVVDGPLMRLFTRVRSVLDRAVEEDDPTTEQLRIVHEARELGVEASLLLPKASARAFDLLDGGHAYRCLRGGHSRQGNT